MNNNTSKTNTLPNAKVVWGKVITRLRELHFAALHVACGDIKNVQIVGDELIVSTDQEYLLSIITKPENIENIKTALKYLNFNLKPVFNLEDKENQLVEADIQILKETFDEYLKIK